MMPKTINLSLEQRVRESARQPTSLSLPVAVSHRLTVLTDLAADMDASRADIIGMLIAECELDAETLEQRVLAYRKKTVADVVPDAADRRSQAPGKENVVTLPLREPGRPARARARA